MELDSPETSPETNHCITPKITEGNNTPNSSDKHCHPMELEEPFNSNHSTLAPPKKRKQAVH
tara:strand:- start:21 stop:206 length:186 start_codon:yes stop_codon:yes gene_type:complete